MEVIKQRYLFRPQWFQRMCQKPVSMLSSFPDFCQEFGCLFVRSVQCYGVTDPILIRFVKNPEGPQVFADFVDLIIVRDIPTRRYNEGW